jgi:hypothetical protein
MLANLGNGHVQIGAGIKQPRAIEMRGHSGVSGEPLNCRQICQGNDRSARRVVSIFQTDQPGRSQRRIASAFERNLHFVRIQNPVASTNWPRDCAW